MHISTLVELLESGLADRVLIGDADIGSKGAELASQVRRAAGTLDGSIGSVVYVGENHPALPIAVLASAWAGVPFVPLNYRLGDEQLIGLIEAEGRPLVLADSGTMSRLIPHWPDAEPLDQWVRGAESVRAAAEFDDGNVAIVLYTSGTTSTPKAALLRHRNLMAYLLGTVEYASAGEDEAMLVAVPPYHIAGIANLLSNLFAGRRLVYLDHFAPESWLRVAREQRVTHAMVVPTMLARIVDAIADGSEPPTTLRSLAYGGSKVSQRVLERALRILPAVGFVNAYGLTETSSSIAVLGPDDHRAAVASTDARVRRRLTSVGRILPSIEAEIRDDDGSVVPNGETGLLYVRGEQIAGEYATGSLLDDDGWFCTRDRASIDDDGYLFIEGRADDTIIRGGENIAPSEIEEALIAHPAVDDACVVGVPDDEWGQQIVAVVVLDRPNVVSEEDLRAFVRQRVRGSRTPERIIFRDDLPRTENGKLLRRVLRDEMSMTSPGEGRG